MSRVASGGRNALVVVAIAASKAWHGGAVDNVEVLPTEAFAQDHNLLHPLVFVDVVGLGEVSEGFVDEHSGENRLEHDGVLAAFDLGGFQQFHGAAAHLGGFVVEAFNLRKIASAAQADAGLLDIRAVARHGVETHHHVENSLVDVGTLRVSEDAATLGVAVGHGGGGDAGGAPNFLYILV